VRSLFVVLSPHTSAHVTISALHFSQSLALLIGKDGAAKVKAIAVQDPYTSATAKLTGAGYKLSNLKLSEVFVDGAKAETDITFGDKGTQRRISCTQPPHHLRQTLCSPSLLSLLLPSSDAPFTVLITGKDGKVAAKETGKLNVVSFSEFTAAKNAVMGQIAAAETVRLNKLLATKTQESA
jgi:hypothetical protein